MNVLRVLWLLVTATVRNRIRAQAKRLKQPKYLIATIVGLSYFWFLFGRRAFQEDWTFPPELRVLLGWAAVGFGIAFASSNWIFGRSRAPLAFTEAEIQFLFPGPVSRRALVLYKLVRTLLMVGLSALIATLIFGARGTGNPLFFLVGFWLALSTLAVHESVASLSRRALLLRGASGIAILVGSIVLVLGGLGALALLSIRQQPYPGGSFEPELAVSWLRDLRETPLGVALYPVRASVDLALAATWRDFAVALPGAFGVLALHVVWMLRSDVAFEEAAVETAERRAKAMDARRDRRARVTVKPRRSLSLPSVGRPEWALAWKGWIALRRLFGGQLAGFFISLGLMAGAIGFIGGRGVPGLGWAGGLSLGLVVIAGAITLFGPTSLRADFRADHAHVEVLKTLPLSGAQIVVGEVLGPMALLTATQWILLFVALLFSFGIEVEGFPIALRIAIALCAALIAPFFTLAGLLVQNAAVLLFPSWVATGPEPPRGFEATGQRLLTFVGGLLVWIVAVLPAGAVGAVVLLGVWLLMGPAGSPIAALAVAAVLALEAYFAVRLLGRVFERWDPSAEAP